MAKMTGTIKFSLDGAETDASSDDEAQDYLEELAAAMAATASSLGYEVDFEANVDEFTSKLVAQVTITASASVSISYDPDEQDIQGLAEGAAEDLLLGASPDYEVEVEDEDTGDDPMYADVDGENL